jgi:hypothetical protein
MMSIYQILGVVCFLSSCALYLLEVRVPGLKMDVEEFVRGVEERVEWLVIGGAVVYLERGMI